MPGPVGLLDVPKAATARERGEVPGGRVVGGRVTSRVMACVALGGDTQAKLDTRLVMGRGGVAGEEQAATGPPRSARAAAEAAAEAAALAAAASLGHALVKRLGVMPNCSAMADTAREGMERVKAMRA